MKDEEFSEKFASNLEDLGLNPNTGNRRGKIAVWASSQILDNWMQDLSGEQDRLAKRWRNTSEPI